LAFSNNQVLAAADLNNLADLTTAQTFTGVQSFNGVGNPKVNSSTDFVEQSSTPSTPSSGNARLFSDNANPPLLKVIQDDGDVHVVGGWQYNESRRGWELYDRDLTTALYGSNELLIRNDFMWSGIDTTAQLVHALQGTLAYFITGTPTLTTAGTSRDGGALKVTTAAATNDRVTVGIAANGGSINKGRNPQFLAVLRIVDTANVILQIGVSQDPTAATTPGTDGVYFQYNSSVSANWRAIVRASSADSNSDTGLAIAAAADIHLLWVMDEDVDVKFYTRTSWGEAWTLRATNVGTQPSAAITQLPFLRIQTLTTAAKTVDYKTLRITAERT
jgi:hypothetical protein